MTLAMIPVMTLVLALAYGFAPSPAAAQPAPPEEARPAASGPPAQPPVPAAPASAPEAPASALETPASGPRAAASAFDPPAPAPAQWLAVPRTRGRLTARDLGLVINVADPYSVAVGEYYAARRRLRPAQVLRVELPLRARLQPEEFDELVRRIDGFFGARVQALALAWVEPYAVQCNSLTGALALGFDADLCRQTCAASRASPYANSASTRPLQDHGLRLSMLLAAPDADAAKRLIDRGVAADGSLGRRGAPLAEVFLLQTRDGARNVRERLYPPPGRLARERAEVHVEPAPPAGPLEQVLLLQVGAARVPWLDRVRWLDGGLGDHLTSFGGQLTHQSGQTRALDWIASGATASYGTVSEPCNHLQKFPHPQWLLLHYLQGASAIEAYWKSVRWPQQGLFVGEPLAAPFARRR